MITRTAMLPYYRVTQCHGRLHWEAAVDRSPERIADDLSRTFCGGRVRGLEWTPSWVICRTEIGHLHEAAKGRLRAEVAMKTTRLTLTLFVRIAVLVTLLNDLGGGKFAVCRILLEADAAAPVSG